MNRSVTATLTTAAAEGFVSPSYTMPAIVFGKDWATFTIGTAVTLGRGITGSAIFSSEAGQSNLTTYGAQLGLNVAFPSH